MKRHATLGDVFWAGTQAVSPFLQDRTEKLKERNDLELRVFSERFTADLEIEKNNFPYSGDYNGYLDMLNKFCDKKFTEAMGQQTSEYSRKQLDQMQRLSKVAIEMHVDQQRAQWQYKNREVGYANRQNININSQAMDMPKKLQALLDEHELHAEKQGWQPDIRAKDKAKMYRALAERELAIDIGGIATVSQAHAELEERWENLAAAVDGQEGAANSLDGWVPDNRDMLEKAKDAATKAIWKRNFDRLDTMDHEYRRLWHDAKERGDYQGMLAAAELRRQGALKRDAAMKSEDFDPGDRARIASMFPDYGQGEKKGSGSGSTNYTNAIRNKRAYIIQGINDGAFTFDEGKAMFADDVGKMAAGYEGGAGAFEEDYAVAIDFPSFWKDTKKQLLEDHPEYAAAFSVLDNIVKPWAKKAKNAEEMALRELQGAYLGMYLFDVLTDEKNTRDSARMSPDELAREAQRVSTHMVEQKIAFVREKEYRGRDDKTFAATVKDMEEHGWALFTADGSDYSFSHDAFIQGFKEQTKDKFTAVTGIPLENIVSVSESPEGPHDKSPALTVQVAGLGGGRDGNYRFKSDDGKKYRVQKYENGEWGETEWTKQAGEAERDRKKENDDTRAAHDEGQQNMQMERDRAEVLDALENFKEEDNKAGPRGDRAELLLRFEAAGGKPDDLWRSGIDPATGEAVKEIPQRVWEGILKGLSPEARGHQERYWADKGVRKGGR